jgi:hypothetical protein
MTGKAAPVHPRLIPKETPEADLIQIFIAKNGVTKPTPKQEKRYARNEQRDRGLLTASNPSAYRFRPTTDTYRHRSTLLSEGFTLDHKPLPLEKLTGKYAEEPEKPLVVMPPMPPVPVVLIPGVCHECKKRLPRRTRAGAKFCSSACKQADHRRRRAREEADKVFKAGRQIAENNHAYDYRILAIVAASNAQHVSFMAAPDGLLVIEEVPGAATLAVGHAHWQAEERLRRALLETEYRTGAPEVPSALCRC